MGKRTGRNPSKRATGNPQKPIYGPVRALSDGTTEADLSRVLYVLQDNRVPQVVILQAPSERWRGFWRRLAIPCRRVLRKMLSDWGIRLFFLLAVLGLAVLAFVTKQQYLGYAALVTLLVLLGRSFFPRRGKAVEEKMLEKPGSEKPATA